MYPYSKAIPSISAVITTKGEDEDTTVLVAKGDTLTDLEVMSAAGTVETIESATVLGVRLGWANQNTVNDTVLDGVPLYRRDSDGNAYRGHAEETYTVESLVLEIPGAEEEDPSSVRVVGIGMIKAFTGGEPVSTDSGDGDGEDEHSDDVD